MTELLHAAGVIIIEANDVLLVRHGEAAKHITGSYGLPAGTIEPDESEEHAARRELKEETGLVAGELVDFRQELYTGVIERKTGEMLPSDLRVFICKDYTGMPRGTAETTPQWVTISNLPNYPTLPKVIEAVRDALEFLKQNHQ